MAHFPENIEKFIISHFETVNEIKVICFFSVNHSVEFSAPSVSKLLDIGLSLTGQILHKQFSQGFLIQHDAYYLFNHTCEKAELIRELDTAFRQQKEAVLKLL